MANILPIFNKPIEKMKICEVEPDSGEYVTKLESKNFTIIYKGIEYNVGIDTEYGGLKINKSAPLTGRHHGALAIIPRASNSATII